jgi:DNA-binding PadR family transcriptional regulator
LAPLINYAVLALVIERPSYGYEIAERFDRRFGEFLPATQSNVYDVLKRLERDELIEEAGRGGSRGRPQINYRATAEGGVAYRSWLVGQLRADPQRSELLSRLASTGLRRAEVMMGVIDCYEEACLREGLAVATRSQSHRPASVDAMVGLVEDLIVEERRRAVDAQLGWIAYARNEIRARAGWESEEDRG